MNPAQVSHSNRHLGFREVMNTLRAIGKYASGYTPACGLRLHSVHAGLCIRERTPIGQWGLLAGIIQGRASRHPSIHPRPPTSASPAQLLQLCHPSSTQPAQLSQPAGENVWLKTKLINRIKPLIEKHTLVNERKHFATLRYLLVSLMVYNNLNKLI